MRRLWLLILLFPLLLILLPACTRSDPALAQEAAKTAPQAESKFRYPEAKHGNGQLRYVEGIPVLIVGGTPAEIGEQMGVLTAKPARRLLDYPKEYLKRHDAEDAWPNLVSAGNLMFARFPEDYRQELEAGVKASGVDRDLIVVGNTLWDIKKLGGCSTLIIEADRSATKAPLFGRNLDFPTLGYLQDYSIVTVCRPKGKHAFASIGFPGVIGCISGMNDAGLSLAVLEVYSANDGSLRFDATGTPYLLCYRRLLEECTTVDEAEKLLRSMKRTTMTNLAICDKNGGAVFEITSKNVVVRKPEDGVCPCTNHFRTEKLATKTECRRYDALCKACGLAKVDLPDVAQCLHAANQGEMTLQTMIFEPASLRLHLAIGSCPSSAQLMRKLELGPLLKDAR